MTWALFFLFLNFLWNSVQLQSHKKFNRDSLFLLCHSVFTLNRNLFTDTPNEMKISSLRKAVIKAPEEAGQRTPRLHFSINLADWTIGAGRLGCQIASGMLYLKCLGWCNLCGAQALEHALQKFCDLHKFWSSCRVLCPTGLQEWGNIIWNVLHARPSILVVRAKNPIQSKIKRPIHPTVGKFL